MNIVEALRGEEVKLRRQLSAIQGAIAALNGSAKPAVSAGRISIPTSTSGKRTISAAARAKMSRKAKDRWAKIKAAQGKGKATK